MSKKISVLVFAAIILLIPLASVLSPYRTISEDENRALTSFPVFNFDEFTSKRFMHNFDSFVSDHIVLRDGWTTVKAEATTLLGKRDNKGVYLGDNCLIENLSSPKESLWRPNLEAINTFAARTRNPAFLLLAPTAGEIERDKLPPYAQTYNQASFIRSVGRQLKGVSLIDTVKNLSAHKSEYIYYRTDHHWTSLGAYYAYSAAGKLLGYDPLPKSGFRIERATTAFNGTLYSKSGYRNITPDAIDFYTPKSGPVLKQLNIGLGSKPKQYTSIYFRNFLKVKDKYSVFFDGNQPLEDIRTNSVGKRLLVIKDSYAHSLVPFLMNHYSRITMVDTRYLLQPLDQTVNLRNYDQILFVYNVDTFATDQTIPNIN
ncbi:MAG TPA: DHHW family protein [Clostridia bacterium]|nr:DHHW family protein [Clostridia bacterium]